MRKFVSSVSALAFIVATSANPAMAAVTLLGSVPAADPGAIVLDGMQSQCSTLAEARDTGDGDIWTGEVVLGAVTLVSGPTYVGTHSIADAIGDPVGAGTFTPAHLEILGDPYRNGGSVNMFGIQQSVGGYYSASTYDFLGDFDTTYSHAFSCDIVQEDYNPPVLVPGSPVEGYYINCDFGNGQGNDNSGACDEVGQPQGSCLAHTNAGPTWPGWGRDTEQCKFIVTKEATDDSYTEESWDPPVTVGTEAGIPIELTQSNQLLAHEDNGEGFSTDETLLIGQVVVCISPSSTGKKLPGEWRAQNGYDGGSSVQGEAGCNTGWYNGGAMVGVPNLNDGSHNYVTVPIA